MSENEYEEKRAPNLSDRELLERMYQDLQKIRLVLYGNGKPGALENIRNLEADVKSLNELCIAERLAKLEDLANMAKWLGIGFGGLILSFIFGILTHQISIQIP